MKPFISPLARTANSKCLNEKQSKLTKSGFRSPLQPVDASKKEKAAEPPNLLAPSQSIATVQAINPQHVVVTQDGQILLEAEPRLPGTQISGTTPATTAPLSKAITRGLKKSEAFKAPAKAQHAVTGKENKAGGQAISSCGAGKSASRTGEPIADEATYYACLYFAKSKKKRPSQQDGVLQVLGTKCCLYSQEGKIVGKTTAKGCMDMPDGATLEIGMWELEVFNRLPASAFLDGSCFLGTCLASEISGRQTDCAEALVTPKPAVSKPFKNAVCVKREIKVTSQTQCNVCRYAVDETSTVLYKHEVDGTTYAVVIDPFLALKLRPHQKEGVRFMYSCVMGLQTPSSSGCLLADEMGLGKTLQTLTLIWSLLKQGPLGKPAIRRAVVVCPSSLVENWGNEVKKWLGQERLRALAIHAGTTAAEAKAKFDDFINGSVWPLLITSYELARKYSAKIAEAKCGLLVCDEAHRLKNSAGNKTIEALLSLSCARRVLLSGTPLQNNLSEFFAMMSFIAPELLGSLSTFKRLYADPIERSRDRTATEEEKLLGEARSAELNKRTQLFILRRTSEVNAKYLPPRTEYVVFCKLQQVQIELYQALLRSQVVSSLLTTGTATTAHSVLATIGLLRKLCNHPHLLMPERTRGSPEDQEQAKLDGPGVINIPQEVQSALAAIPCNPGAGLELSGKFAALMALLQTVAEHNTRTGDRDKVVVVSEWTATLDVIQEECARRSWHCLRLDGSTAMADRQSMVNRFNSGLGDETIFLLSKKAGGCGLNLIGAHRLVLFDSDWNPANDKQAMARIWRDGQTKPVVIYRLLSRGSIEEKIYQRQIAKDEVAAQVTGAPPTNKSAANQRHFSKEQLRELFTLRTDTLCDTRDLVQGASSGNVHWEDASPQVSDEPLRAAIDGGLTTFVHQQLDQSDLGVEEEEAPQPSKGPSGTEGLRQTALQETKEGAPSQGESKLLQSSARAADSRGKRPMKRRKRVVCSDSEPENGEDEKIFEELDDEED